MNGGASDGRLRVTVSGNEFTMLDTRGSEAIAAVVAPISSAAATGRAQRAHARRAFERSKAAASADVLASKAVISELPVVTAIPHRVCYEHADAKIVDRRQGLA